MVYAHIKMGEASDGVMFNILSTNATRPYRPPKTCVESNVDYVTTCT